MKNPTRYAMEQHLKFTHPNINWDYFELKSIVERVYTGSYPDIFSNEIVITIEEHRDYVDGMIESERYAHGYVEKSYRDSPIRYQAVVIVERRKRWIHKESGKVVTSDLVGFRVFEGTTRPEDQIGFLK